MVFGDERPCADRRRRAPTSPTQCDIAENLMPIADCRWMSPDVARPGRALRGHRPGQEFGRNFDTGSCEIASATARRVGLGKGVERSLKEAVEWWNGDGPPEGLKGDEIASGCPDSPRRRGRRAVRRPGRHGSGRGRRCRARSGGILDPAIVDDAHRRTRTSSWPRRAAGIRASELLEVEPEPVVEIALDRPDASWRVAFGDLADMKMPWTHGHSGGVAKLAGAAAKRAEARRSDTVQARALRAAGGSRKGRGLERDLGEARTADGRRVGAGADALVPLGAHPGQVGGACADGARRRHASRAPRRVGVLPRRAQASELPRRCGSWPPRTRSTR